MYDDLQKHVTARLGELRGEWVGRNSGYEDGLCNVLGFEREHKETRHWDAKWGPYTIELKKGKTGAWFDLVRYSEVLIERPDLNTPRNVILVFITDASAKSISGVIGVSAPALIERLGIGNDDAKFLVQLNTKVPYEFNAQAKLKVSDLRAISSFNVGMLDDLL